MATESGTDLENEQADTIRAILTTSDRQLKLSQVFTKDDKDLTTEAQCKSAFERLKTLMRKEMRLWWDCTGLQRYIDECMVPRGLRIKKSPSTIYSDLFIVEWNDILSKCSFDLMRLISTYEEKLLVDVNQNIVSLKESVMQYRSLSIYDDLNTDLQLNISNLETEIMETKRSKYLRDLKDYEDGTVYIRTKDKRFPYSILKKRSGGDRRVNFSSPEVSDTQSEFSDTADPQSPNTSRGSVSSVFSREESLGQTAKNFQTSTQLPGQRGKRGRGGGHHTNDTGYRRYPRKAKKTQN